jgi:DNA-binding NarL/FixJ family response regulator
LALMTRSRELATRLLGAAEGQLDRLRAGPYATELYPSQDGARRYQFHRDCTHVRELRTILAATPRSTFEAARAAGRALTTQQTISLLIEVADQVARPPASPTAGRDGEMALWPLSQRETEVLRLVANGNSNQQIAATLVLSVRTVERHIANLYAKVGARNRADATAYALRHNIT